MANIISKTFDSQVSPMGGIANWAKINNVFDDYEGKKKYMVDITFQDKATEQKLVDAINKIYAEAQAASEFSGKAWRNDTERLSYKPEVDKEGNETGRIQFHFQTKAFFYDKDSGEEKRRYIPVLNVATKTMLGHDTAIGNGSEIRIQFTPSAYWMNKGSNGINLYIGKIVVDKLVEYGGNNDDFSAFGIADKPSIDQTFLSDEEIPI